MRIPISNTPRMYKEVLALSIHRHRPDFEVLLAPPESLDGRTERFWPHVLVQDADEVWLSPTLPDGVLCRIRLLDTGRTDARIDLDGTACEVQDVSLEDLFEVLNEADGMVRDDDE